MPAKRKASTAQSEKYAAPGLQSGRGFALPDANEQVNEKTDLELARRSS